MKYTYINIYERISVGEEVAGGAAASCGSARLKLANKRFLDTTELMLSSGRHKVITEFCLKSSFSEVLPIPNFFQSGFNPVIDELIN